LVPSLFGSGNQMACIEMQENRGSVSRRRRGAK
jgi:hypothetical protein